MSAQLQNLVDQLCGLDEDDLVTVINSVLSARPESATRIVTFAVPDLTYPSVKAVQERRGTGTIKSFNEGNGFGFIDCPQLKELFGNDVFLHHAQLGQHTVGSEVSFAIMLNKDGKPQAFDLQHSDAGRQTQQKFQPRVLPRGRPTSSVPGGSSMSWDNASQSNSWTSGAYQAQSAGQWSAAKPSPWDQNTRKRPRFNDSHGAEASHAGHWSDRSSGNHTSGGNFHHQSAISDETTQEVRDVKVDEAKVLGKYEGIIKSFNRSNGYGFIDCEEIKATCDNDTFLHKFQLGSFQVGDSVTFTAYLNQHNKPQAKDLEALTA